ncbi:MAG: alpha-L-rhamnosidase C-terminal domain-containing protein, partial [Fermentimonas sp.]|nr:alpha-L-rhamnosidase C-terminal domain-containing protein [Fermentimonas sp.]
PYGTIVSDWKWDNGIVNYNIVVPPNSSATFYLPKNAEILEFNKGEFDNIRLDAGSYTFKIKLNI